MSNEAALVREYVEALKAEGLWGWSTAKGHRSLMEEMWKREEIKAGIYAKADGDLPIFFLDKIETAIHMQELAEELVEEHSGMKDLTAEEFWRRVYSRPNHDRDMPGLLLELWGWDCLREEDLPELIITIWSGTEFPEQNGDTEQWIEMLLAVGWVEDDDGEDSGRPMQEIRLWRGAIEDHAVGMAWTGSQKTAEWFAHRFSHGGEGRVYSRVFSPDELLAHFVGRGEDEYLVDIRDIDISEMEEYLAERWVTCTFGHKHWGANGAAGILLHHEGRILLAQRSGEVDDKELWSIPGGAISGGRSPWDTATREFREETGLRADAAGVPGTVHVEEHGNWRYSTFFVNGHVDITKARLNWETSDLRWFTVAEALALSDLHEGVRSALGAVQLPAPSLR